MFDKIGVNDSIYILQQIQTPDFLSGPITGANVESQKWYLILLHLISGSQGRGSDRL